jgi:hypothetical protein
MASHVLAVAAALLLMAAAARAAEQPRPEAGLLLASGRNAAAKGSGSAGGHGASEDAARGPLTAGAAPALEVPEGGVAGGSASATQPLGVQTRKDALDGAGRSAAATAAPASSIRVASPELSADREPQQHTVGRRLAQALAHPAGRPSPPSPAAPPPSLPVRAGSAQDLPTADTCAAGSLVTLPAPLTSQAALRSCPCVVAFLVRGSAARTPGPSPPGAAVQVPVQDAAAAPQPESATPAAPSQGLAGGPAGGEVCAHAVITNNGQVRRRHR